MSTIVAWLAFLLEKLHLSSGELWPQWCFDLVGGIWGHFVSFRLDQDLQTLKGSLKPGRKYISGINEKLHLTTSFDWLASSTKSIKDILGEHVFWAIFWSASLGSRFESILYELLTTRHFVSAGPPKRVVGRDLLGNGWDFLSWLGKI